MSLAPNTMRRLAFIKHLHTLAEQQASPSELFSAPALLTLHDAVEMFLALGCEHHNANPGRRPAFEDYWGPLCGAMQVDSLPEQVAMRRLNNARVALKHHGQLPAAADTEGYRHTVATFFVAATPLVFGVPFDGISMAEFIEPPQARTAYMDAERWLGEGNLLFAAEAIAVAFHAMSSYYTAEALPLEGRSAFHFIGPRRSSSARPNWGTDDHYERAKMDLALARAHAEMQETVGPMREALRILALGLDFRKYARFISLMPTVSMPAPGEFKAQWWGNLQQALTAPYLRFCLSYTVECALTLGAFRVAD